MIKGGRETVRERIPLDSLLHAGEYLDVPFKKNQILWFLLLRPVLVFTMQPIRVGRPRNIWSFHANEV